MCWTLPKALVKIYMSSILSYYISGKPKNIMQSRVQKNCLLVETGVRTRYFVAVHGIGGTFIGSEP